MKSKLFAALAAASLVAAPATAQAARVSAPVGETESLGGGVGMAWIAALIMAIGAILILTDGDDTPESA